MSAAPTRDAPRPAAAPHAAAATTHTAAAAAPRAFANTSAANPSAPPSADAADADAASDPLRAERAAFTTDYRFASVASFLTAFPYKDRDIGVPSSPDLLLAALVEPRRAASAVGSLFWRL
jgi:hypothetical protein